MICKEKNKNNYPPGVDRMTEKEKAFFDRANAEQIRMTDVANTYALVNFNNSKENFNLTHYGLKDPTITGQGKRTDIPKEPQQPEEVCFFYDYSKWVPPDLRMYQRKELTGNLLGEPYEHPTATRPYGYVQLGRIDNDRSMAPFFSVYKDSNSNVPVDHVYQEVTPGGQVPGSSERFRRYFRLMQVEIDVDNVQLRWFQIDEEEAKKEDAE